LTIQNNVTRNQYTANGVQTAFTYTFEIFNQADIEVYDGATLKTITTHYTVSGVGSETGGTVTFLTAPANGNVITFRRNTVRVRSADFQASGAFKASTVNAELDRPIAMIQELDLVDQLALKIPATDAVSTTTVLPIAATRANKALVFDASGNVSVSTDNYVDQATNTAASAAAAAASASAASTSETNASTHATSALSYLNTFRGQYYGSFASDPTLDPLGAAMNAGDLYFNTTTNTLQVYSGSAWGVGAAGATSLNTPNTIVARDGSGNFAAGVITGTATTARYADLAEHYSAPAGTDAGTVVKLATQGKYEVAATTQAYDVDAFGVVSTKPGFLMNYAPYHDGVPVSLTNRIPVALAGRVPVKVIGKVRRGQRITTSPIEGVAQGMSAELLEQRPALLAAVLGRALEDKQTDDIALVECVVIAQR
jgi:hypothetical protein